MWHLRTSDSTACQPRTYCGALPDEVLITDGNEPPYIKLSYPKLTDPEFVRSLPKMPNLCPQCVKLVYGIGVELTVAKAPFNIEPFKDDQATEPLPF